MLCSPLIVRLDPDLAHVEEEASLKANAWRFRKITLVGRQGEKFARCREKMPCSDNTRRANNLACHRGGDYAL